MCDCSIRPEAWSETKKKSWSHSVSSSSVHRTAVLWHDLRASVSTFKLTFHRRRSGFFGTHVSLTNCVDETSRDGYPCDVSSQSSLLQSRHFMRPVTCGPVLWEYHQKMTKVIPRKIFVFFSLVLLHEVTKMSCSSAEHLPHTTFNPSTSGKKHSQFRTFSCSTNGSQFKNNSFAHKLPNSSMLDPSCTAKRVRRVSQKSSSAQTKGRLGTPLDKRRGCRVFLHFSNSNWSTSLPCHLSQMLSRHSEANVTKSAFVLTNK